MDVSYLFRFGSLSMIVLCTCCFLEGKKKKNQRGATGGSEIVLRDSIFFDRLGDRTSARLTFKTKVPATCQYTFYPQDQPTPDAPPQPILCSDPDKPRSEFNERISPLLAGKLYFLTLTAKNPSAPGTPDTFIVREPEGGGGTNSPAGTSPSGTSPSGSPSSNGDQDTAPLSELFVGRVDMALKSAEVLRHVLKTPLSREAIRNELKRTVGCQDQAPTTSYPFRSHENQILISQLATKDLGTALSTPRPDLPGVLNLDYSAINDGIDKWTFMYRFQDQDQIYSARPVVRLAKVQLISDQTYDLDIPNLDESSEPVKINPLKELKIQWTVPPQTPATSYVTVQIGRPTLAKSVFCVFQADQRTGTIPPQLLSNLQSGRHVISVELATTVFLPKEKWITTAYDWRSGRIEK